MIIKVKIHGERQVYKLKRYIKELQQKNRIKSNANAVAANISYSSKETVAIQTATTITESIKKLEIGMT